MMIFLRTAVRLCYLFLKTLIFRPVEPYMEVLGTTYDDGNPYLSPCH